MQEIISPMLRMLDDFDWGEYAPMIRELNDSPYGAALKEALRKLDRPALYESHVHGPGHIERTMLHGAMCALREPLDAADTALLLDMCSYHDTGRISDWLDGAHGARAALKLAALTGRGGDELNMMMAGVEAHSLGDKALNGVLERYPCSDPVRERTLAELLKDSDGLDRVRINDLNPAFLRREASRSRAAFAQFLFDRYVELETELYGGKRQSDGYELSTVTAVRNFVYQCRRENRGCAETAMLVWGNLTGILVSEDLLCPAEGEDCLLLSAAERFLNAYGSRFGISDVPAMCAELRETFLTQYGTTVCRELLAGGSTTCPGCIVDGCLFLLAKWKKKK